MCVLVLLLSLHLHEHCSVVLVLCHLFVRLSELSCLCLVREIYDDSNTQTKKSFSIAFSFSSLGVHVLFYICGQSPPHTYPPHQPMPPHY